MRYQLRYDYRLGLWSVRNMRTGHTWYRSTFSGAVALLKRLLLWLSVENLADEIL